LSRRRAGGGCSKKAMQNRHEFRALLSGRPWAEEGMMADLKRFKFQLPVHKSSKACFSKAALGAAGCILVALGIMLSCLKIGAAQQEPISLAARKTELEVQKLALEVAKHKEDRGKLPGWITAVLGILAGIAGTAASVWAASRSRLGELDQSVHDKRLESYP
jgi:hypothetical protein